MEVIQGDITTHSGADVLVNVVTQPNKKLESNGEIAKAFAQAGEDALKREVERHLPLTIHKPVISTIPGKLNCKKVIHIKADKWTEKAARLEELFDKTFSKLKKLEHMTIAIPVFGGGFLGIKPEVFYLGLLKSYNKASKDCPQLKVTIVSFERDAFTQIKKLNDKELAKKRPFRQLSQTEKPLTPEHLAATEPPLVPRTSSPTELTSLPNESDYGGKEIDVYTTVESRLDGGARIPKCWKNFPGEATLKTFSKNKNIHEAVQLEAIKSDYDFVTEMFLKTFKNDQIKVNKILRIENIRLLYQYELCREKFCLDNDFDTLDVKFKKDGDTLTSKTNFPEINKRLIHDINEKYLFHGTKKVGLEAIIRQGFDSRVSAGGYFGTGTYFAEHPAKSNDYTDNDYINRVMVLSRVILGDVYKCREPNRALRRPPCTRCSNKTCDHRICHSVIGTYKDFREFVIYDQEGRTYPEFVIYYNVDKSLHRDT